jgi:hypothetical protein
MGDRVLLHLDKQHFKNQQHHKLKSILYGPYTIIEQMGPNAFELGHPTSTWHSWRGECQRVEVA